MMKKRFLLMYGFHLTGRCLHRGGTETALLSQATCQPRQMQMKYFLGQTQIRLLMQAQARHARVHTTVQMAHQVP